MVANADEHDVDLVKSRHKRHIGKQIRVACVIKRRSAADRDDQAARVSAVVRRRIFVFFHCGAVPGWHKRNAYFALQQLERAAEVSRRIRIGQVGRITEHRCHCCRKIICRHKFGSRSFSDLDRISHVIGMSVRDQD